MLTIIKVFIILEGRGRPFLEGSRRGTTLWEYPPRVLGFHKRWKSLSFWEIWNNPSPPFFFIGPSYKKALQNMEFYDKFVDGFRDAFQKKINLLSARQRPNNYLEISKGNVLGNIMLSHWLCLNWKFFMIWFYKILKLIFQKQPSCPRNICPEYWRKLPNLTALLEIFLYLKRTLMQIWKSPYML